jgi:hypothetical protein
MTTKHNRSKSVLTGLENASTIDETPSLKRGTFTVNRQKLIRKFRDHLSPQKNNSKHVMTARINSYIKNTNHYGKATRDSSLNQASQEIERINTKFERLKQERDTIEAMNNEMQMKKDFIDDCMINYGPFIKVNNIPSIDIFNMDFEALKLKYTQVCKMATFDLAAKKIQKMWRIKNINARLKLKYAKEFIASRRIQRQYKKFTEKRSPGYKKKQVSAVMLQKYVRGMITREKVIEIYGFAVLGPSLGYLNKYREKVEISA